MTIIKSRYDRTVDSMKIHGIDVWLSTSRESHFLAEPAFRYLLPVDALNRTCVIVAGSGERICVCTRLENEEFDASGLFTKIVVYGNGIESFMAVVAETVKKLMPIRKLALNFSSSDPSSDGLNHSDYLLLESALYAAGFDGSIISAENIMYGFKRPDRNWRFNYEAKRISRRPDRMLRP